VSERSGYSVIDLGWVLDPDATMPMASAIAAKSGVLNQCQN